MLYSTPTQWIVLALALVAGWLLGLASHPGGKRWRARYAAERDAHAATRAQAEAHVADARRTTAEQVARADARVKELETENARLAATPTARGGAAVDGDRPVYAPDPVRPAATATTAARPAYPAGAAPARRGWFEWR